MRLLNTTNFTLKVFFGDGIPEYAILSHTWGEEEVLFKDIEESTGRNKKGFSKVKGICDLAECSGFEWVWIDTCCIDKSSSSELSEAINSMYKWYANAHTCYVYLADVHQCISQFPIQQQQQQKVEEVEEDEDEESTDTTNVPIQETSEIFEFQNSRWFTRGWTLQELLAPDSVEFYTSDWQFFGTKDTLADTIFKTTGIERSVLLGNKSMSLYSVAEKMSWAARRSTTREEDMAYCLIGLFQINMPLLYGEGQRAFIRLQDEVLKNKEDYTLFAWVAPLTQAERQFGEYLRSSNNHYSGFLAPSPVYFADNPDAQEFASGRLKHTPRSGLRDLIPVCDLKTSVVAGTEDCLAEPPTRTARGIRLSLPMIEDPDSNDLLAYIHCRARDDSANKILCLVLRLGSRSGRTDEESIYQRSIFKEGLRWLNCRALKSTFTYKTVYVEEVAFDIRQPIHIARHGVDIFETDGDVGILIFGKPNTNVGLTAQVQFQTYESYTFEIVHRHSTFFVGLSTPANCEILPIKMLEVMRKESKVWIAPYRSADTVSLGKSSWINVLAKVAPKNWIDKHGDECARKGWKVRTSDSVNLLYVWADSLLEYVGAHGIHNDSFWTW